MIHLWLVETDGNNREFDLGLFKARTEVEAIKMAATRHPFIGRLVTHTFGYRSQQVADRRHGKMGNTDR